MTPDTSVLGACPHDCPDTCALVTTVQDGVAVKLQGNPEHPHTAGVLCTKVSRYIERNDHPERLRPAAEARRPQGQRPLRAGAAGTRRWTTSPRA